MGGYVIKLNNSDEFHYGWEEATRVFFLQYPILPYFPVINIHTLNRTIDKNGNLVITRLIETKSSIPPSFRNAFKIKGPNFYKEKVVIDKSKERLVSLCENIEMKNLFKQTVMCIYKSKNDNSSTKFSSEQHIGAG